jgi:hypothetical protein
MAASLIEQKPSDEVTKLVMMQKGKFHSPLRVFVLGLKQIQSGEMAVENLFVGWRFVTDIIMGDNKAEATAVFVKDSKGPPTFSGISTGPKIADSIKIIDEVKKQLKSSKLGTGKYELQLYRIPGLLTDCYWLRPLAGGGEDWVFPFQFPADKLAKNVEKSLVPMAEFFGTIRDLAVKRLASKQGPEYPCFTGKAPPNPAAY